MRKKDTHGLSVLLLFIVVVFLAIVVCMIVTVGVAMILVKCGIFSIEGAGDWETENLILMIFLLSIPVGIILAVVVSKIPLKPFHDMAVGMNALASGDFSARIDSGPVMKYFPPFVELTDSFNKMAQELQQTEMLRGDFINNFSHEFKTPIASIAGFAKLLNRGSLTAEQQREYLSAIEEESLRLSNMATNVLNLTKVENQSILTDVSRFNLSEQIRSCILLLENTWEQKALELQVDFGEYQICANEELLKQVWINLLDNAVKFSPEGHTVRVQIGETRSTVTVTVTNTGSEIPVEYQHMIWGKFYQVDPSRSTQGNGVGLAIVKRVVELHGGRITVSSANEVTAFSVELPVRPA